MVTRTLSKTGSPGVLIAALALLVAACSPDTPPPPEAPAPPAAPMQEAPGSEVPPADAAEPAPSPAPDAPPPTEPSAVPKPTSAEGLDVRSMQAAVPGRKISVPVELRYHFEATPVPGQPVTLHLAALPRMAGSQLKVSVKMADGLEFVTTAPLRVAKAAPGGVYRHQITFTRRDAAASRIRVLVTMNRAEGSGFGFFTIPLDGGKTAQKERPSVKQR